MPTFATKAVSTPESRKRLVLRALVFGAISFVVAMTGQALWPSLEFGIHERLTFDLFFALVFGVGLAMAKEEERENLVSLAEDHIATKDSRVSRCMFLSDIGSAKEFQASLFRNGGIRVKGKIATGFLGPVGKNPIWIPIECEGYSEVKAAVYAALQSNRSTQ